MAMDIGENKMSMTTEQMFKHMLSRKHLNNLVYRSKSGRFRTVVNSVGIFFYKDGERVGYIAWGSEWYLEPIRREATFIEAVEAWYNGKTIQSVDPDNQDEVYDEYSRNRSDISKGLYIAPAEVKSFIWYILEEQSVTNGYQRRYNNVINKCFSHPKFFTADGKEIKYNDNVFGGFMNNNEYECTAFFLKDDGHPELIIDGEIMIRFPKSDVKGLQQDITELREQNGLLLDQVEELEEKLRDSEKRAFEWNLDCVLQEIKNKELPAKIADLEYRLAVVTQQRDNWREKYDKEIECLIERMCLQ